MFSNQFSDSQLHESECRNLLSSQHKSRSCGRTDLYCRSKSHPLHSFLVAMASIYTFMNYNSSSVYSHGLHTC